jgi:retron-type reverse transcriptase
VDKKNYCITHSSDAKKEFDSLDFVVVLNALQQIGCSNNTIKFFNTYLTGRQQCVEIGSSGKNSATYKSTLKHVEYGIPQGSCISPELYDIVTLDLYDNITCANAIQYADDINLSIVADTLEDLNRKKDITINKLQDWCEKKRLVLNSKKSVYMVMSGGPKTNFEIDITLCAQ